MEFLIAQCDAMAKQLLRQNLAKESSLKVIYNPVNPDLVAKVRELRLSLPVADEAYREITFIGRIDPQKNPADLIEAYEKLLDKVRERGTGQKIVLRMVGSGNLEDRIRALVKEKGLTDNVIFDGIRQDMENVYATADVVALSSDYEGMPNCLIEAIASGIPVVSYDCPFGPGEIITEANGYLVPMGDTGALAEALYTALYKDWDVDAITASASKFSPKLAASELVDVFKKKSIKSYE